MDVDSTSSWPFSFGEREAWRRLRQLNPADVCKRSLARFETEGKRYLLTVLNEEYAVSIGDESVWRLGERRLEEPDLNIRLMILLYLINAEEVELSGRLVTVNQFKSGEAFFRGTHNIPVEPLLKEFGSEPERFLTAGESLGGRRVSYGDFAVEFKVLPRIPSTYVLWTADDEFTARITILLDSTAERHLPLDGLLAALSAANNRLLEWSRQGRSPSVR